MFRISWILCGLHYKIPILLYAKAALKFYIGVYDLFEKDRKAATNFSSSSSTMLQTFSSKENNFRNKFMELSLLSSNYSLLPRAYYQTPIPNHPLPLIHLLLHLLLHP